jgi:hypothetical protein
MQLATIFLVTPTKTLTLTPTLMLMFGVYWIVPLLDFGIETMHVPIRVLVVEVTMTITTTMERICR